MIFGQLELLTFQFYEIIAWYPGKNVEERAGDKGLEADW